ncbi:MAG: hypothetical protein ACREJX_21270, partial [Polyangiaceae bacterium]
PQSVLVDCELYKNKVQITVGVLSVTFGGPPTPGTWAHAHIDLALDGRKSSAVIAGVPNTLSNVTNAHATTAAPRVRLGLASDAGNQAVTISFDNVELRYDTSDAGDDGGDGG